MATDTASDLSFLQTMINLEISGANANLQTRVEARLDEQTIRLEALIKQVILDLSKLVPPRK